MRKIDKKTQIKIFNIILIVVWIITVFMFSGQKGEDSSNTSGTFRELSIRIFIGEIVGINSPILQMLENIIRKLAHYTIYTIGGFLIMNYAYTTDNILKYKILYSICFGIGYAITDEIHQFFVPGRSARFFDVGIDSLGVITGVFIYLILRRFIKTIINRKRTKKVWGGDKSEYKCDKGECRRGYFKRYIQ